MQNAQISKSFAGEACEAHAACAWAACSPVLAKDSLDVQRFERRSFIRALCLLRATIEPSSMPAQYVLPEAAALEEKPKALCLGCCWREFWLSHTISWSAVPAVLLLAFHYFWIPPYVYFAAFERHEIHCSISSRQQRFCKFAACLRVYLQHQPWPCNYWLNSLGLHFV